MSKMKNLSKKLIVSNINKSKINKTKKNIFWSLPLLGACILASSCQDPNSITVSFKKEKDTTSAKTDTIIKPQPELLFKNQRTALYDGINYHVVDSALYKFSDGTIAFLQRIDTSNFSSGLISGSIVQSISGTIYYQKPDTNIWKPLNFKIGDSIKIGSRTYLVVSFELSNKNKKFNLIQFLNTNQDSVKFFNEYQLLYSGLNTITFYYNLIKNGKVSVEQKSFLLPEPKDLFVGINSLDLIKTENFEWKKEPYNFSYQGEQFASIKNFFESSEKKQIQITLATMKGSSLTYQDTTLEIFSASEGQYNLKFKDFEKTIKIGIYNVDFNGLVSAFKPAYYLVISIDGIQYSTILYSGQDFGITIDKSAAIFTLKN